MEERRDPGREETESHGDDDCGVGETNRFTAHTLAEMEALHVKVVTAARARHDAFASSSRWGLVQQLLARLSSMSRMQLTHSLKVHDASGDPSLEP